MEMTIGRLLQKAGRMSKSGRVRAILVNDQGERTEFEIADIRENKRRGVAGQRHVRSQRDATIILRAIKTEPVIFEDEDYSDAELPPDVTAIPVSDLAPATEPATAPVKKNKGGRPRKVKV